MLSIRNKIDCCKIMYEYEYIYMVNTLNYGITLRVVSGVLQTKFNICYLSLTKDKWYEKISDKR